MKPAKDWVTAYDVSGMNTASAAELEEWVGKIQEDAQFEMRSELERLIDVVSDLDRESIQRVLEVERRV